MPPRVNAKAQAGRERKVEQKAQKEAEALKKREAEEAKEWQKGANSRAAAKSEAQAAKADEAARKRREKAELLAAEEAELGAVKPKKAPTLSKKKGKKKKDDLSLLEDALVSAADKKVKAKKREERLKKEKEAAAVKAATKTEEEEPIDPLLANTEAMIGGAAPTTEDEAMVGREANKAAGTVESGIDAALDTLNVSGGTPDAHPEKRVKALHRAFEEKMMPVVKEEYPGLRLTQYKEKIFQLWKKSPENPLNQQPPPS